MKFGQSNGAWTRVRTRVTDICNRAFQILRGTDKGDAFTDWLEAERELLEKPLSNPYQPDGSSNKNYDSTGYSQAGHMINNLSKTLP
jgi:hypothetical protein